MEAISRYRVLVITIWAVIVVSNAVEIIVKEGTGISLGSFYKTSDTLSLARIQQGGSQNINLVSAKLNAAQEISSPSTIRLTIRSSQIKERAAIVDEEVILKRIKSPLSPRTFDKLKSGFPEDTARKKSSVVSYLDAKHTSTLTLHSFGSNSTTFVFTGAVLHDDGGVNLFSGGSDRGTVVLVRNTSLTCSGEVYADDEPRLHLRSLQAEHVWNECYIGQEADQELKIGMALSSRLMNKWKSSSEATYRLTSMLSGMNLVYKTQLNVEIVLDDILQGYSTGESNSKACGDIAKALFNFRSFEKPSNQGSWQLLDDCISYYKPEDVIAVGYAFIGSLCSETSNTGVNFEHGEDTWLTVAHELGHNFGALHSFENGVGTTGGIMDYGDGTVDGRYQFNSLRKKEVCGTLSALMKSGKCEAFGLSSCFDRSPTYISFDTSPDDFLSCEELAGYCSLDIVSGACPQTCHLCLGDITPTAFPTVSPTVFPIESMEFEQTIAPTTQPTAFPTVFPTAFPTETSPTGFPTVLSTSFPTGFPTTAAPSAYPTQFPT